jgi:hypothetical protein
MEALHPRRIYDYRIQEAICESGDRDLFPELKIPRSTIRSWIHSGTTDVVSCDFAIRDRTELVAEIENLRRRTALLGAVVGLLTAMLRVSKSSSITSVCLMGTPRGSSGERSSGQRRSCRSMQRCESRVSLHRATTVGAAPRLGVIWMTSQAARESSLHA